MADFGSCEEKENDLAVNRPVAKPTAMPPMRTAQRSTGRRATMGTFAFVVFMARSVSCGYETLVRPAVIFVCDSRHSQNRLVSIMTLRGSSQLSHDAQDG